MSFELEGTLIKKFDTQQIKDTFKKREFVVETDEQYPQQIKVELTQDKCELLDDYNEGDKLKVHFNLRGREWNGKYFVNINGWRIEKAGAQVNAGGGSSMGTGDFPPPSEEPQNESPYNDDLPF
jgi:single-strand DNA-binding protein